MHTDEERIIEALKKAEMGKTDLVKITGLPYGPLGHVLNALVLRGRVEKVGLRFKLREKSNATYAHVVARGAWGSGG